MDHNHYEINTFDEEIIDTILESQYISDYVYGIEIVKLQEQRKIIMMTPRFHKFNNYSLKEDPLIHQDFQKAHLYAISLEKSSFFPLDTRNKTDIIATLNQFEDYSFIFQLLVKKSSPRWRYKAIDLYEEYLKGNDEPIDNKVLRTIQTKMIGFFNTILKSDVKRTPIQEIEDKILSELYHFECRMVIFEGNIHDFEDKIQGSFRQIDLFNSLKLKRVDNKENFLQNFNKRIIQTNDNILSKEELYSFLIPKHHKVLSNSSNSTQDQILEQNQLLQNLISLMPNNLNVDRTVPKELIKEVNSAFIMSGVVKNRLVVNDSFKGATTVKIQFKIPKDTNYSKIIKKLPDIQACLGNKNVSIEIGNQPNTVDVILPSDKREVVYLRDILESDEFQIFKEQNEIPFVIGEDTNGEFVFGCLAKLRHLLIAGTTGSGKSVFLNQLLLSLILNVPIEMLNMYLIDPKMVEFSQFNGFPQVKQVVTDARKACQLLNMLCEQMDERYSVLAANGCKNIDAYNKKKKETMPYIVLVIDEYADLLMVNEEIEEYIVRLSQKARACGIHLIIATQKPLEKIVTSVLKSNLPSVIGFKLKTSSDYRTVFGKGIPYNLTGMGDGVAMLEGYEDEFIRFQSPIISTDELEEEQIIKDIKKLLPNSTSNNFEKEIEITSSEQPIDKLKRIIATTRETRIGELRKAMGIRINIVSDLMKQLCDEGWLTKEGRNYVITADEETLNEWRD